jgi:hypothetical protein
MSKGRKRGLPKALSDKADSSRATSSLETHTTLHKRSKMRSYHKGSQIYLWGLLGYPQVIEPRYHKKPSTSLLCPCGYMSGRPRRRALHIRSN